MSTSQNPFIRDHADYKRDIDIKPAVIDQISKYISLRLKISHKQATEWMLEKLKDPQWRIKDPTLERLLRKGPGWRIEDETTFLSYIEEIIDNNWILSPALVAYKQAEDELSPIAEWQEDNIAARKKSKTNMFVLKQAGQLLKSALADYDQNARKIRINAVSGQHGSEGNPLYQATGHYSLTALCRAAAGYGNGTVERFLTGSKHYHTPEIAKANLVAILTMEDKDRFKEAMDMYELVYPSVDDVLAMVERSTSLYWESPEESAIIRDCITGMTDLERAIVTYSGDMFHLAKYNPDIIREFMGEMIIDDISTMPEVNTDAELKTMNSTDVAYINALCADIMIGSDHKRVKVDDPAGWQVIGKTARRFKDVMSRFRPLISTFFVPRHLPPTVASLKGIQRRACLAADTDSSIFTCESWVKWYSGDLVRGRTQDRIWYLTTYMACQCIAHSLAMLSANVGVEAKNLFRLAMKNEYAFPVFALTNLAKHYFSLISMREGNVYEKMALEIKGVELRGSTMPKETLDAMSDLMEEILNAVNEGRKLNAKAMLTAIAEREIETIRSIKRGEYKYLKSAQIKPNSDKIVHFQLWQEVFAPKYGDSVQPPFPVVKVTTELTNKTLTKEWLDSIEDRELANRMIAWFSRTGRDKLPTMYLPTQIVRNSGLPVEIQEAANVRKLAYQINSGFYRLLESTGLAIVDRNHHRLVHDFLRMTA